MSTMNTTIHQSSVSARSKIEVDAGLRTSRTELSHLLKRDATPCAADKPCPEKRSLLLQLYENIC